MSPGPAPTTDPAAIRRIITILSVCGFASGLSTRFVDPMVGAIARDLRADPLTVALLSTAFALPYALIQPVLGPVGDALGKERIMKVLLFVLAATLLAASLTPDLTALFGLRMLSGAVGGGIIPMSLAMIGDRVAMSERQVAIGRFLGFAIAGHLLGGLGSGVVADQVGWRGAFALAAALALGAGIAVVLGFRDSPAPPGSFSFPVAAQRYRHVLGIGRARALMAFVFIEGVLVLGLPPYIAPLLEAAGAGGPTEAGLVLGGFAVGGIIYTVIVRWLLGVLGLRRMLTVAGFVVAGALAALAVSLPWGVEAAAMLVMGLGFYMMHNSFQTQMTEVAPDARASAVSMHAFFFFVGQALGPVVFGLLLAHLGRAGAMAVCATGIVVTAYVAAAMFGEGQRAR